MRILRPDKYNQLYIHFVLYCRKILKRMQEYLNIYTLILNVYMAQDSIYKFIFFRKKKKEQKNRNLVLLYSLFIYTFLYNFEIYYKKFSTLKQIWKKYTSPVNEHKKDRGQDREKK